MPTLEEMGVNQTLLIFFEAVLASRKVVLLDQQSLGPVKSRVKTDGTVVMDADLASEEIGYNILLRLGRPIWSEERKRPKLLGSSKPIILYDLLDGTRNHRSGAPGVTVIAASLDEYNCVNTCVVVEVATGRVFFATIGHGTWVFHTTGDIIGDLKRAARCRVWTGKVKTGTLRSDLTPGFTKPGYRPISDSSLGELFGKLFGRYRVQTDPNGVNHSLVAFGREEVVASITTALGGPWDVAPLLLVLEAGGYAIGYNEGQPVDARLVLEYNVLVTGNSKETVIDIASTMLNIFY